MPLVKKNLALVKHTLHGAIRYSLQHPNRVTIELMELVESSLDGLPYQTHDRLIKQAVKAISKAYVGQGTGAEGLQLLIYEISMEILLNS